MILALVLLPAIAGLAAFVIRRAGLRRLLLLCTALAHSACVIAAWRMCPLRQFGDWLVLDSLGLLFLSITSSLFLAAAFYATGYLAREARTDHRDSEEGMLFSNAPEATFTGCLLLFLSTMTLVAASQHFGILWVAVEATTLASAPLIHFHRHHRSLEATWKYLLICSVGIAVALLGNFFLAAAVSPGIKSCSLAKAPATTVIDGLVLSATAECVTLEAVTVALGAVFNVTLKVWEPPLKALVAGRPALASLE